MEYDSEGSIFTGSICKKEVTLFNEFNSSKDGKGFDLKHEIVEYNGNFCYIRTERYCFKKSINYLTGLDYKESHLDITTYGKRRSNVIRQARNQPSLKDLRIVLGYYNGKWI